MNLCAIHQPNFFPWLGYFDKISRADIFVFMDDGDNPKSGSGGMGSWSNRVKINVHGNAQWLGCPVNKKTGNNKIKDVLISNDPKWRKKALKTLQMNYAKSENFPQAMDILEPLILNPTSSLSAYNTHAIIKISEALGLHTKFVWQSRLGTSHASTDVLIEICKAVDANQYLAGSGAGGYQDDDKIRASGIELIYQNFKPEPYGETKSYVAGLSVIDYLMHQRF